MNLLQTTLQIIHSQNESFRLQAKQRLESLTMPHWAMGRLLDLAVDLAGMRESLHPQVTRKVVIVMAGDHGVAREGVSKYPSEVTAQMVANFVRGGATVNALADAAGCRVVVVDMGVAADLKTVGPGSVLHCKVGFGTRNMAQGPAMTRDECLSALETGIDIFNDLSDDYDLFATGDMGIGNTTPSAAILCALTGISPEVAAGRGTGLDDAQLAHKIKVIEQSLEINRPDAEDGLDILTKVGGFEIAGLTGLFLAAAAARKPILVDGFISTAAALIAQSLAPLSTQYMIAAHRSVEPGHSAMLKHLGMEPLLDLNLRLGEGAGAVLAMPLVEASQRLLTNVATFDEAKVSGPAA